MNTHQKLNQNQTVDTNSDRTCHPTLGTEAQPTVT